MAFSDGASAIVRVLLSDGALSGEASVCPECGSSDCTLFWPDDGWGEWHCNSCGCDFQGELHDEPDVVVEVGGDAVTVVVGGRRRSSVLRRGTVEEDASEALRLAGVEGRGPRVVGLRRTGVGATADPRP